LKDYEETMAIDIEELLGYDVNVNRNSQQQQSNGQQVQ